MKQAWCIALAMMLAGACAPGLRPVPQSVPGARAPSHVRVKLSAGGPVRRIPLEDYVRGAVISEFVPAADDRLAAGRMLEVQAVIVRTYAVAHQARHQREGFDLCATTHCQLYDPARLKTSAWASAATESTRRTAGMVLWYGTSPASALYHSDCGGHTSAAGDVWGGTARPYLTAVVDDGPAEKAHASWRFAIESDRLIAALNADPRTRVGRELAGIAVTRRDRGGRAALVTLSGARTPLVRGEELRAVLTRAFGPRAIRSTRFDVERTGAGYVFAGRGFGHGVGLCQAGALARLRAGATPRQVLRRYYPGTSLVALR